jgi:hypothetical protein
MGEQIESTTATNAPNRSNPAGHNTLLEELSPYAKRARGSEDFPFRFSQTVAVEPDPPPIINLENDDSTISVTVTVSRNVYLFNTIFFFKGIWISS